MRYLIVTADDYGMCDVVNKAIDDCMAVGLVTTTNVIVNMDDLAPASTLRQRFPDRIFQLSANYPEQDPGF